MSLEQRTSKTKQYESFQESLFPFSFHRPILLLPLCTVFKMLLTSPFTYIHVRRTEKKHLSIKSTKRIRTENILARGFVT